MYIHLKIDPNKKYVSANTVFISLVVSMKNKFFKKDALHPCEWFCNFEIFVIDSSTVCII